MDSVNISRPLAGAPHGVGDHFFAQSFNRRNAGGQINPLLMVDHFWMKRDTFGWHPHHAISAVTYVFEDSKSAHYNYDATGNNLPIRPGSLHWMVAGSGTTHCERPEEQDALVHGLQFFVDLPDHLKTVRPYAVHLDGEGERPAGVTSFHQELSGSGYVLLLGGAPPRCSFQLCGWNGPGFADRINPRWSQQAIPHGEGVYHLPAVYN